MTVQTKPLPFQHLKPGRIVTWTLLFIGGLIMVTPLAFMFSTSLKTASQVYDLRLIPAEPTLQNYATILADGRFLRWFMNSMIVAVVVTASNVFLTVLSVIRWLNFSSGAAISSSGDPLNLDDPDRNAGHPVVSNVEQTWLAG